MCGLGFTYTCIVIMIYCWISFVCLLTNITQNVLQRVGVWSGAWTGSRDDVMIWIWT